MKRIFYMSLAALTLGISSCTNEELSDSSKVIGNDRIVVDLPGATTRTHMDETNRNKVLWTTGDEISIFSVSGNQCTNNKYTLSSGEGTQSGEFTGGFSEGSTKKAAFYPYVDGTTFDGSKISFNMSNNLTLDANKPTENNKAPMACIISDDAQDKISFKNAGALLDITVKNIPTEYKKIVLTSKGENAPSISGAMEIEFSDGNPTLKVAETATTAATNEDKTVAISFTLTDSKDLQFFFPIPAGNYPELSLTLYKDNDSTGTKLRSFKGDSDNELTVNKGERLYATVIFDKVTGDIAASVNSTSDVKEAFNNADAVSVTGEITGSNNTVTVPTATSGSTGETTKSLSLEKVASGASLTVSDDNSSGSTGNSVDNFTLSIPNNETTDFQPLDVTITMPNTTVTLTGNAGTATYGNVTAETAKNTLIIGENVTIKKLTVKKGNVRLKPGAVIKELVHDNGSTVVYLYHETDQYTLPEPLPKKFKTMDAAIADMKAVFTNGGSYQLTKDMELVNDLGNSIKVTVKDSKSAILDLNGFTLKASNNSNIVVNGTLTIKDSSAAKSGKIMATKDQGNGFTSGLIEVQGENAKLVMESGIIDAVRENPAVNGQTGVFLTKGGDFSMTGGEITAGIFALTGNGNDSIVNSEISIKGGKLSSATDYAVYLPQAGTTTVEGGTISGGAGGICIQRGTLNISGTETVIKSLGTGSTGDAADGTGGLTNAAICVAAEYGDCTVSISEGQISGERGAVCISEPEGTSHNRIITITGGTFTDLNALTYLASGANVNIKLNKSCSIAKQLSIAEGTTVTIDLNKNTLTGTYNGDTNVYGTATIKNGSINVMQAIRVWENGNLTLDGVHVKETTHTALQAQGPNVKLTVKNNSVIEGKYFGCSTNASNSGIGQTPTYGANATLVLQDSEFKSEETGFMNNVPANVTMTNCKFSGTCHGALLRGGEYTIKNSTFTLNATKDKDTYVDGSWHANSENWADGNRCTYAAITIGNQNSKSYKYYTKVTMEKVTANVVGTYASQYTAVYAAANKEENLGVTWTYNENCVFGASGQSSVAYGNNGQNITVNGSAPSVNQN